MGRHADRHRACQESRHCRYLRVLREPCLCKPGCSYPELKLVFYHRRNDPVRSPDLFRFRGVHRYRNRQCEGLRVCIPGKFQPAVLLREPHGLLAPLAYDPLRPTSGITSISPLAGTGKERHGPISTSSSHLPCAACGTVLRGILSCGGCITACSCAPISSRPR